MKPLKINFMLTELSIFLIIKENHILYVGNPAQNKLFGKKKLSSLKFPTVIFTKWEIMRDKLYSSFLLLETGSSDIFLWCASGKLGRLEAPIHAKLLLTPKRRIHINDNLTFWAHKPGTFLEIWPHLQHCFKARIVIKDVSMKKIKVENLGYLSKSWLVSRRVTSECTCAGFHYHLLCTTKL
jgi:hypothetical protein